jgi:Nuclease-related domain
MRVVRVGRHDLGGREQWLWAALAALLGLAALGIVVAFENPGAGPLYLGAGVVAVLTALRLGGPVTRRLRSVRKGRLGERLVVDLLSGLPDDYCLVNDVTLGLAHGKIDHVLIGPCGVVVIETRRLAGTIRCSGNEWSVDGHRRDGLTRRADSGACAVRYYLSERHPELTATALRWVESLIVFTHPLCRLEVNHAPATIVRYSQLFQAVLELGRKHHLAPTVAAELAQTLVCSQTRGAPGFGRGTVTTAS